MEDLKAGATLADVQDYVTTLERERGFAGQTPVEKCLLLGEEIGELFKAVRKQEGLPIDQSLTATLSISGELADVLIYLCSIANRFDINLEDAFREKEKENKQRIWVRKS